ncbi:MAG: outer membrane protein transport protein [Salinivirgaceae bacterium]
MKKIYALLLAAGIGGQLFAGGIVTNTNQSAQWVRLLSRNASTQIDAVYFNPAGLVRMDDGFHFSLHNQTIFQEKTVTSTFPTLNTDTYTGDVKVPIYPSFFGVYKKEKLAISFGFGINGGGGSAEFSKGLPSFEMPYSMLPGLVSSFGIPTTAYSTDIYFKGSSIYWGAQLGGSYAINDMLAVSAGARLIIAKNSYEGTLENVMINPTHPLVNPTGAMMSASAFFTAIGQPGYAAMTSNMVVDATQSGTGVTPFFGINLNLNDKLNIGIKYEMNTKLELTNESEPGKDANGMFLNDSTFRSDIPAILAIGAEYSVMEKLRVSASYNLYFDKNADWNGREDFVDDNLFEIAFGAEYDVTDKILVSAGYLIGKTGVNQAFQTDIDFSLSSNTIGFGGCYKFSEKLSVDLGVLFTSYKDASSDKTYPAPPIPYTETYDQTTTDIAIGVNYKF